MLNSSGYTQGNHVVISLECMQLIVIKICFMVCNRKLLGEAVTETMLNREQRKQRSKSIINGEAKLYT